MKGITEFVDKDGSPIELMQFRNRLARSYGAGRLSPQAFELIARRVDEAIALTRKTKESTG